MLSSLGGILLGRRTYEGFAGFWPTLTEPEADAMNTVPKYVFSSTFSWPSQRTAFKLVKTHTMTSGLIQLTYQPT